MVKKRSVIEFAPCHENLEHLILHKYLSGLDTPISSLILEAVKDKYLAIAMFEAGVPNQQKFQLTILESISRLKAQIEIIDGIARVGGNLEILPRNYGGGYIPVQSSQIDREPAVVKVTPDEDELDDDDSIDWDEPMIKAVKPLCNFDN